MVPGSLEEKEVHEKKEIQAVNTKAWKKLEVKEEECMSKLVLPQPPRLVKRTKRRKVKLPELIEGQQEIKNFLKAATLFIFLFFVCVIFFFLMIFF